MGLFSKPEVISPGGDSNPDYRRIDALEQRVAKLEVQLAQLAQLPQGSRGIQLTGDGSAQPWLAEVQALCRAGRKINAIKLYREHTGVGLKEAKDAVEALPA